MFLADQCMHTICIFLLSRIQLEKDHQIFGRPIKLNNVKAAASRSFIPTMNAFMVLFRHLEHLVKAGEGSQDWLNIENKQTLRQDVLLYLLRFNQNQKTFSSLNKKES